MHVFAWRVCIDDIYPQTGYLCLHFACAKYTANPPIKPQTGFTFELRLHPLSRHTLHYLDNNLRSTHWATGPQLNFYYNYNRRVCPSPRPPTSWLCRMCDTFREYPLSQTHEWTLVSKWKCFAVARRLRFSSVFKEKTPKRWCHFFFCFRSNRVGPQWKIYGDYKHLFEISYPLEKSLPVVECMNARLIFTMNPFHHAVPIHINTICSHRIALCRAFKAGCLQPPTKKKRICVALLTKHKKSPLQRLNWFTPLHPPTLSFGRNNVAALLDCYPSPP